MMALRLALKTVAAALVATTSLVPARADDRQAAVSATTGTIVRTVHGVGAQVYECKTDGHAGLAWSFREPIATLVGDDKTVGRHFAGPSWEMVDGSLVVGKVVATAPGTSANDIPWLKLDVSQHQGSGLLSDVTIVQRLATVGGQNPVPAPCRAPSSPSPMRRPTSSHDPDRHRATRSCDRGAADPPRFAVSRICGRPSS